MQKDELATALQQRADYIPIEDLEHETAGDGAIFQLVQNELLNKGLRTIVGPRGCGKTHMMRYAWLTCKNDKKLPFSVYLSFNRYFRLEPLLSTKANAIQHFHSWVLARVSLAVRDSYIQWGGEANIFDENLELFLPSYRSLLKFVNQTERNQPLSNDSLKVSDNITVDAVKDLIDQVRQSQSRKFTVLLLDDAALTLTPEYLIEFLDIVRSLKSTSIAPKASVYPGTTEVSPKFHQGQDAIPIPVWVSLSDPMYDEVMQSIAEVRIKDLEDIKDDTQTMFRFASFGIPRAYLTMLEEFQRGRYTNTQQGVNQIIQKHLDDRVSEFRSLGKKVPKLSDLIGAGETVIGDMCKELKAYNAHIRHRFEKSYVCGIVEDDIPPIVDRMFNLLGEAGLLYYDGEVKHGTPARVLKKYIPHSAALLSVRAIDAGGKGGGHKQLLDALRYKSTKHPLRKRLSAISPNINVDQLSFSLPECSKCGAKRLTDDQAFCHKCGNQLIDASTFNDCLDVRIEDVPGLTDWQIEQINTNLPSLKNLRDFLAKQDPAADFLSVRGFGQRRTAKIVDVLNGFIDDYLS